MTWPEIDAGGAVAIALFCGYAALIVHFVWPKTEHACRYPACPHRKEKE